MARAIAYGILVFFALSAAAQTIDVRGTVTDVGVNPFATLSPP